MTGPGWEALLSEKPEPWRPSRLAPGEVRKYVKTSTPESRREYAKIWARIDREKKRAQGLLPKGTPR
jgi:hypothetical protein